MKRLSVIVGLIFIFSLTLVLSSIVLAQGNSVRPSLAATVTQKLGTETVITIDYSRPGVKGRKIWGDLVPYGLAPGNRYSKDKPFPWRAGANETTTIEFGSDLVVEGKKLAAGKYSIHMIPSEKDWTIIFSTNDSLWGSYLYNQEEDALRVTVTPVKAPHKEWLSFDFEDLAGTSATVCLHWEKLKVPFKVKLTE